MFPIQAQFEKVYNVFMFIAYVNYSVILIFSILWALYLVKTLWKDYKNEKINSRLRNNVLKDQWLNAMKNFRSNRVKNRLLLVICSIEIVIYAVLICNCIQINFAVKGENLQDHIRLLINIMKNNQHLASYDNLEKLTSIRIYSIGGTLGFYTLTFFIRIVTQYIVYQYSYFKQYLNMKLEIYIRCTSIFFLIFMGGILKLLMIYFMCIVLLLYYEYIGIVIESRKLRLLLKQRLSDAILHENQSQYVIRYYRIGYKDYRICSIVMLIALFAKCLGVSLYCIYIVVWKLFQDYLEHVSNSDKFLIHNTMISILSIVNAFIPILLALGTSIQALVYLIASIRRLFRFIKSRINIKGKLASQRSSIQSMIERNNMAYRMKNEFRNV